MTTDELQRRRLETMVQELMVHLKARQGVNLGTDSIGDVDLWRKAARIAGRRLGIPVRTGLSRDGKTVWASEGP